MAHKFFNAVGKEIKEFTHLHYVCKSINYIMEWYASLHKDTVLPCDKHESLQRKTLILDVVEHIFLLDSLQVNQIILNLDRII